MERHSPVAAKKLWNFLRVAFFMMKKGLISKRKLIMDMNLVTERGKLLGSTLANLVFHHHRHPRGTLPPGIGSGLREYEFSCSNTPVPIFHHAGTRRRHNYFPCINATPTMDEREEARGRAVVAVPMIEYSPQCAYGSSGERRSPLPSPFSVRVSNYSLEEEEEEEEEGGDGSAGQVDAEAEEFIKRFYEQLRAQRGVALLQYQEMVYQEMIARGT